MRRGTSQHLVLLLQQPNTPSRLPPLGSLGSDRTGLAADLPVGGGQPVVLHDSLPPTSAAICLQRLTRITSTSARMTSSQNSLGYGFGMVAIHPAR